MERRAIFDQIVVGPLRSSNQPQYRVISCTAWRVHTRCYTTYDPTSVARRARTSMRPLGPSLGAGGGSVGSVPRRLVSHIFSKDHSTVDRSGVAAARLAGLPARKPVRLKTLTPPPPGARAPAHVLSCTRTHRHPRQRQRFVRHLGEASPGPWPGPIGPLSG